VEDFPGMRRTRTKKIYPISAAESFGLDIDEAAMNKLRRDFDINVDYAANDTEFEGKKRKTIYFKNLDDAIETYGAYLARKKQQVKNIAEKKGIELTGDEQDYWMYAAYNAGSGNVEKLLDKVKKENLQGTDYTNKVWDSE
jgi:hypothetical protein